MITQDELKHAVSYNPETGEMVWRNPETRVVLGQPVGTPHGGYRRTKLRGKYYTTHRLAWLYVHGEWPEGQIDHINGDRSDNRIKNLRDVSVRENNRNQKTPKSNKSGVMGVYFCEPKGAWVAQIRDGEVRRTLCATGDFFEAVCARKSAERRLGYHPNHGRI